MLNAIRNFFSRLSNALSNFLGLQSEAKLEAILNEQIKEVELQLSTKKRNEEFVIELHHDLGTPIHVVPTVSNTDHLRWATTRVRETVQSIAPKQGRYRNDKTKQGRSLRFPGPELATVLNTSKKFDSLVRELRDEGINVIVKKTKAATRLHIKRRA